MSDDGMAVRPDGTVELSGALTFETVPRFFAQSGAWFNGAGAITVNLKNVTRVDSAGVALLLEWRERTRAAGRELSFTDLPEQLRHMIRVSGLDAAFAL